MKIAVLLAEGFEIAEAMCPADVFRRAGLDTVLISVSDSKDVRSSCGIIVTADKTVNEAEDEDFNAVFCPGGMPGSVNLSQSWEAGRMIVKTAHPIHSHVDFFFKNSFIFATASSNFV